MNSKLNLAEANDDSNTTILSIPRFRRELLSLAVAQMRGIDAPALGIWSTCHNI